MSNHIFLQILLILLTIIYMDIYIFYSIIKRYDKLVILFTYDLFNIKFTLNK